MEYAILMVLQSFLECDVSDFMACVVTTRPNLLFKVEGAVAVVVRRRKRAVPLRKRLLYHLD